MKTVRGRAVGALTFAILLGAGASGASGNLPAARGCYAKLKDLTAARDTDRPELARASAFLSSR